MKFFNLKYCSKWLVVWLSIITMVMSPIAMGQEAQNISTQQVKNALEQMGLNRKITVGEFYEKTKHLYPERIRLQIEPVLMNFKNTMMPEFSVTSGKGNDGREITNMRMTYNGQLLNFQWFGEKDKFLKFQNTNLTEIDLINFNDMFSKVLAGDENMRKQIEVKASESQTFQNSNKKKSQFEYPTVSKEIWVSMTPQDRANYMIHLRLLWNDARQVLTEIENQKAGKNKKTSFIEKFDYLWKNIFEHDAAAAKKVKARNDKVVKPTEVTGDSTACLVAGYVTSYSSRVCDHNNIKKEYLEIPDVKKANSLCGTAKLACNPIIFGTPGGNPICIDPKAVNFQIATHYSGPCETLNGKGNNHLGSEIAFLKNDKKEVGRYSADNIIKADIKAEVKNELAGNYEATQDFLNGLLKFRGAQENLFTSAFISEETLKQIREIKNQFETDIASATASCIASSNEKTHKDKNFWKACDQLQRRFIFVEEYLQQKCPAGSTINDKYKCACGGPDRITEVMPGEKVCTPMKAPVDPVSPPPAELPIKPMPPEKQGKCPAGQIEKKVIGDPDSANAGVEASECVPSSSKKTKDAGSNGIWNFMKKLAPVAIGGIALFAMYKLFSPKAPTLKSAGDFCPNGSKPPCGQICSPPLAMQSSGICGCAACPPGQSLGDATTCMCSSAVTPTTNVLICPDGVTRVSNLSNCPVSSYSCWDGSKVTNPLNCPEKPTTIIPKTSN